MTAADAAAKESATRDPAPAAVQPLKPRRGLLVLCSIVFGLWVAGMVVMYFTTVYPNRHREPAHTTETSESTPR